MSVSVTTHDIHFTIYTHEILGAWSQNHGTSYTCPGEEELCDQCSSNLESGCIKSQARSATLSKLSMTSMIGVSGQVGATPIDTSHQ